jgi:hypothetical protein
LYMQQAIKDKSGKIKYQIKHSSDLKLVHQQATWILDNINPIGSYYSNIAY